jgi:hypothetical protein
MRPINRVVKLPRSHDAQQRSEPVPLGIPTDMVHPTAVLLRRRGGTAGYVLREALGFSLPVLIEEA